jgi:hypothetical protein
MMNNQISISFFGQQNGLEVFIFSKELYNTVCAKEVNTPQQQQQQKKKKNICFS